MSVKGEREKRLLDRRRFLRATLGIGGLAAFFSCDSAERERFLWGHSSDLSESELRDLLDSIEDEYSRRFGRKVDVEADGPIPGVEFGYALDLSRCIGCRRCVYACVEENNLSREPQIHWIRVLRMEKEHGIDEVRSTVYYNPGTVPEEGHFYMPVQCHQCENPPCVKVCPVGATWQEPDGVTVIDYDWCIGCRYCMAACPYGARHFNWGRPTIPADEINPDMHLLGNRIREVGVVEKCHFCLQRSRRGRYPACVEACPVGARKFGDLREEGGEMRYLLENKRVILFKEELNTRPRFFYFYGS